MKDVESTLLIFIQFNVDYIKESLDHDYCTAACFCYKFITYFVAVQKLGISKYIVLLESIIFIRNIVKYLSILLRIQNVMTNDDTTVYINIGQFVFIYTVILLTENTRKVITMKIIILFFRSVPKGTYS
jgi:hypothetical protein